MNQGTLNTDSHYQKLGRGKEGFHSEPSEGTNPAQDLDFGLLASRTIRE